ncbi:MAG: hypothetical protein HOH77_09025 [Candidatus Latescibacteria bacterium]|jgi:chemotaxis protein MotA|nr:hypothetical protein [Candidatus Latescibacterota bacterium]
MDPTTLLGLLAVLLVFVKTIGSASGHVYNGLMLLVVFGGGLAVSLMAFRGGDLRVLLLLPFKVLFPKKWHTQAQIERIVGYAETARREGILALEQAANNEAHPFEATGLRLAVDGTVPELIQSLMQTELTYIEERHSNGHHLFAVLGINWMLFGLIGTAGAVALGRGLSVDVALPLFYGLVLAGAFAWPIRWKAVALSNTEVLHRRMMMEGIMSIQAGDNPRIIEHKLNMFIAPTKRVQSRKTPEPKAPQTSSTPTPEPASVTSDFHTQICDIIRRLQTTLPDVLPEKPKAWSIEELLHLVDDQTRRDILTSINEPEEIPRLPQYNFEILTQLSDREIQMLLREVGYKELSLAMIGASDAVRGRIFDNVSERVGTLMKEYMNTKRVQSATIRKVVDAQLYMLGILQMLQGKNQIPSI